MLNYGIMVKLTDANYCIFVFIKYHYYCVGPGARLRKPTTPELDLQGPCRVGLVVSVSASHSLDREFASRPGHTKDHHKNGTDCLPVWHAMR